MAQLTGRERAEYVKHLFTRVADRYSLANRWMTLGQDVKWRREVIARAALPPNGRLLDIGTGTGDLALEAVRQDETRLVVGGDFLPEMMRVGQSRPNAYLVHWVTNEALKLPFGSSCFDAVVSGYLLRNVIDLDGCLKEQLRVLKTGGRLVCLDTTPPPADFWHWPVRLYLQLIIPRVGGWVTGDKEAYRYLPESTARFLKATELAEHLHKVGLHEVGFRTFMGNSMAIHWGIK
jgi:demethylmenaquinone methyltransferase/2-methoxy-6-polyprenyl-1,4-benzoquinol methylase